MRRILRDKLVELVRGEEGVALVVTLAVFFFMYLIIAGIYTVGTQVRERIHLQNACDAAAYSAAVVQADTLSRIATINRAMSWTYAQMVKRQMDYIVWKWLDGVTNRYQSRRDKVRDYPTEEGNVVCPDGHAGTHEISWFIGSNEGKNFDCVKLNGSQDVDCGEIERECGSFERTYLKSQSDSFFIGEDSISIGEDSISIDELRGQIVADKKAISDMNDALEDDLYKEMDGRIREVGEYVLHANLEDSAKDFKYVICHDDKFESHDNVNYLELLPSKEEEEDRFVSYGNREPVLRASALFDTGAKTWFARMGGEEQSDGQRCGFIRSYQQLTNQLIAKWHYWAGRWKCWQDPYGEWHHVFEGYYQKTKWHEESLTGNDVADGYFSGQLAMPWKLKESYFGSAGTITVGIACENENPWRSFIKTISGGLYSAFDPYCQKTVVFASAKAGYRMYDEAKEEHGRGYRVDWADEGDWNLYTSEWDAVLIPVRMAKTMASGGVWGSADRGFLGGLVQKLGVRDDEMRSGGDDVPDTSVLDELFEMDGRLNSRRWYASRAKSGSHKRGLVQARWQVGRQGQSPVWDSLTDRMFH